MIDYFGKMKKWKLALCVLALLIVGGTTILWIVYRGVEQRYGFSLAPEVSHELLANTEDRVRLIVKPESLVPYLEYYLPEEGEASAIEPSTEELLRQLLPREIALLARSDLPSDKIFLTLFANERRGGPYIKALINSENVLARIPGVNWNPGGLELRERGSLVTEGTIVFPKTYKESRLKYWPLYSEEQSATVSRDHLFELVIDNSNGDMLTFFAIMAAFLEENWQNVVGFFFIVPIPGHFGPPPSLSEFYEPAVSFIFPTLESIHINANIKNEDTITVSLSIRIEPEKGPYISDLISFSTYNALKRWLKDHLNLILDGSLQWDEKQNLIIGSYTVSGMQKIFKNIISSAGRFVEENDIMFNVGCAMNMLLQR